MTPQEASALLAFARQHDHLVLNTDAQAQTWGAWLGPRIRSDGTQENGVPAAAGQLIVEEYYGGHRDPTSRKPIDASIIRQIYQSKSREQAARQRAISPPPKTPKKAAPRWFIEHQQSRGRMLDHDPHDYEDRPRQNTQKPHTGAPKYDRKDFA